MRRHHHQRSGREDRHRDQCRDQSRREHRRRGPIGRVVRGLAERLGVHHHAIIAAFVVGFVFVPMLTALVFALALYWLKDPEGIERRVNGVAESARRKYQEHVAGRRQRHHRGEESMANEEDRSRPAAASADNGAASSDNGAVPEAFGPLDFPELRRQFEELEARTGAMEACVASEEFALNRQLRGMRG